MGSCDQDDEDGWPEVHDELLTCAHEWCADGVSKTGGAIFTLCRRNNGLFEEGDPAREILGSSAR